MIIKNLTQEQVKTIYNNHMVNDFPASELKPLSMILKGMKKKIFEWLGYVDEESGEILAYAVFVKNGNDYLFDYLAVISDSRNSGIGSSFLKQIAEHYKHADSVIGEVEDPVFPSTHKTLINLPRIDYENSPNKAKKSLQEKLKYKKLSL